MPPLLGQEVMESWVPGIYSVDPTFLWGEDLSQILSKYYSSAFCCKYFLLDGKGRDLCVYVCVCTHMRMCLSLWDGKRLWTNYDCSDCSGVNAVWQPLLALLCESQLRQAKAAILLGFVKCKVKKILNVKKRQYQENKNISHRLGEDICNTHSWWSYCYAKYTKSS